MLIMTTKVDKRKLLIAAAAILAAVAGLLFLGSGGESQPTASVSTAPAADTNDARVKYLTDLGWEVTASPVEAAEVKIPRGADEVFDRYNALQKSQGYDLTKYAGKTVMRYVYQVDNFPEAREPVYATLLVYKDRIIGGDITDTTPGGRVQGFAPAQSSR